MNIFQNNKIFFQIINHIKNHSKIKTTAQQTEATEKRPPPKKATTMPTTRAAIPATGVCVERTIAGKVITAKVI